MSANDKLIYRAIAEAGLILPLVLKPIAAWNDLLQTFLETLPSTVNIVLKSPSDFLTKLIKIPCAARFLEKLSLQASAEQLIPVFSFMTTQVQIEMASDPVVEYPGSYSEYENERFFFRYSLKKLIQIESMLLKSFFS
jgi:hypothetical protein